MYFLSLYVSVVMGFLMRVSAKYGQKCGQRKEEILCNIQGLRAAYRKRRLFLWFKIWTAFGKVLNLGIKGKISQMLIFSEIFSFFIYEITFLLPLYHRTCPCQSAAKTAECNLHARL